MDVLTEKMKEGDITKIQEYWRLFYDWIEERT